LMSILSGAHMAIFPKVMELLRENGVDDVLVMAGGILPDEDIPAIAAMGIKGNFGPGTPLSAIIEFVREQVDPQRMQHELGPIAHPGAAIASNEKPAAPAAPAPTTTGGKPSQATPSQAAPSQAAQAGEAAR